MQTTQSAQSWLWPGFAPIESDTDELAGSAPSAKRQRRRSSPRRLWCSRG